MEPKTVRRDDGTLPARHVESSDSLNALVAGTVVLTLDGALPVEYLSPGDRVITRDSGTAVLRGIRRRKAQAKLVAIRAGTLGSARPDSDAIVPAGQEILVRDWRAKALFGASRALVPAERLADGEFIRVIGTREVELLELQFDAPHILYADGLELASAAPATVSA
ncbi:Hint domain-containing protein [Salipiger sp. P9]|uniref:Hint domain-containing protein n=1 Tax=Salipiger pentaromativorans TaxID=2943193 RepID=UPI0021588730|nr:Hint domain-containing protein [Salipiger pentaromativorans]MCR8549060.1 Hint domain-containing protein [Salipiger pentaromativorans]